jgi:ABC-type transport system substrate-binding protein
MEYFRGGYRLAGLFLITLVCSTTPVDAQAPSRKPPRFGGVLKVATIGEPPSLDPHWTTAVLTHQIMRHVLETLYTVDQDWSPIPHLAAGALPQKPVLPQKSGACLKNRSVGSSPWT